MPRSYVCHELVGVPQLSDVEDPCAGLDLDGACPWRPDLAFGEVEEGTDIEPTVLEGCKTGSTGGSGLVWDIPVRLLGSDGVEWVRAAAMTHRIPCVGYVIQQASKPGALDASRARAALLEQGEALSSGGGAHIVSESGLSPSLAPGQPAGSDINKLLGVLKRLGPDQRLLVGDKKFSAADFVGPATTGCKLTLMGDTATIAPGSAIEALARDCSCVVHEATDMWLPGSRGPSEEETNTVIQSGGHSTPSGAGEFARRVGARALILTHFSQKHQPSDIDAMSAFQEAAVHSSRLPYEHVFCGRDLVSLKISSCGSIKLTEP